MNWNAQSPAVEDARSLLRVVDRLYAAAAGEAIWDGALEELARSGGFDACLLSSVDPVDRRSFVLSAYTRQPSDGGVPGILPPNPMLTESVLRSVPGAFWLDHEIMSPALLTTSDFWVDWMLPCGFVSWACLIVGRRGDQVVCLELYRQGPQGALAGDAKHLLTGLAPHLSRAWRLGEAVQQVRATVSGPATSHQRPDGTTGTTTSGAGDLPKAARLRAQFGLTKAEARLAAALADGCSPAQAASEFDVKLTTIRSQLQQIFAKTGTSRQAELVALLLDHIHRSRPDHDRPRQRAAV